MIGAGLRVLVVGAGIGGLGAARALRRRGFAADVIEREPAWTHTGAGIYLPGNASRALHALGLESALAERASPISHQRLCDHRARLLADIDLAALWDDVGPCLALHRADLHEVLAFHGDPVPIRMGMSLQGLSQQDSTVTVEFDDGSAGRYDLVIGADGIHSTVRQLTVGADAVRPVGQVAWRFVTECPPEVTTWTVLLGRGVTFLAVPIGRGQVYCYCDAPASSSPRPDHDVTGRLAELLTGLRRHPIWPKYGRRRRDGPRGRPGPRRVPCLRARHRSDGGDLRGSAPPTCAMGPCPDAPPGPHPQLASEAISCRDNSTRRLCQGERTASPFAATKDAAAVRGTRASHCGGSHAGVMNTSTPIRRGLGINAGLDAGLARDLAVRCEQLGYHSLWSNDEPAFPGLETLADFAAAAPQLELGVGVLPLDRHQPVRIAAEITRLGLDPTKLWIGVGSGQLRAPIHLVQQAVAELRELLPEGTRIVLAAMRPRMCHLGGAIADAVLLNWMLPTQAAQARRWAQQGADQAERAAPVVASYVRVAVGPGARQRLRDEERQYRNINEAHRRHFEAMDVPLGSVGVAAPARPGVLDGLAPYHSALDLPIARLLTDQDATSLPGAAVAAAP